MKDNKPILSERKPDKPEIREGNTVDILNREGIRVGKGKLISRCPSRLVQDNLPYIKKELPKPNKRAQYGHIWSYERWLVEWVEHSYLRPGMRSCIEVNYYLQTRTQYKSGYDIHLGNENAFEKYIIVEEAGVMLTDKNPYSKTAVKVLNRICRSFKGELVVYTHNKTQARENFEINGVKNRIISFLDSNKSMAEAVKEFIDRGDPEDYIILAGESQLRLPEAELDENGDLEEIDNSVYDNIVKHTLYINPAKGLRATSENKKLNDEV